MREVYKGVLTNINLTIFLWLVNVEITSRVVTNFKGANVNSNMPVLRARIVKVLLAKA